MERQWAEERKLKIRSSEWLSQLYRHYRFFFKDKPPLEPEVRRIPLKFLYTDKDGYLIVAPGDNLIPRFRIIESPMEKRHSSTVVYVKDEKIQDVVPMVISRQGQPYSDEILDYFRVLQTIKVNDPKNVSRCQWLRDCFSYNGHICAIEENRFDSLSTLLYGRHRFDPSETRIFIRQLFRSVAFLHRIGIVHTNLSPRNVLLCPQSLNSNIKAATSATGSNHRRTKPSSLLNAKIQIVGFHRAVVENIGYYGVLTPYCYTAPEVFQGKKWSYACDIWSIGCMIFRLVTGTDFLSETDECEVLELIYQRAPGSLTDKCLTTTTKSSQSIEHYKNTLKRIDCSAECRDLLGKIFITSEKRITAKKALQHPWLH